MTQNGHHQKPGQYRKCFTAVHFRKCFTISAHLWSCHILRAHLRAMGWGWERLGGQCNTMNEGVGASSGAALLHPKPSQAGICLLQECISACVHVFWNLRAQNNVAPFHTPNTPCMQRTSPPPLPSPTKKYPWHHVPQGPQHPLSGGNVREGMA